MIVRPAAVADAEQLVANLHAIVADPEGNAPLAPDEVTLTVDEERKLIAALRPPSLFLVADEGGAICGNLRLTAVSNRRALSHVVVLGMGVQREWRRRGVGRALLAEAVRCAPAVGIRRIELYVYARNTVAIRLYESFGFEHEGRRRQIIREGDQLIDDLLMARLFPAA